MLTRPIPSSGDALPVIGLGTWQTFDVGRKARAREHVTEVLREFMRLGGTVVDTSPMYGSAEEVLGDAVARTGARDKLFLASKVWTRGERAGREQITRTLDLLGVEKIELMQVHNLLDAALHLRTLRELRDAGVVRYIGITHYTSSAYAELERWMRSDRPDFVQLNYSVVEREAERRLLPLAEELGIAVLVNRPFATGDLFARVAGTPLPAWAAQYAEDWATLLLKWVVSHPAVTCAIPATSNIEHLRANMAAGSGALLDAAGRARLVEELATRA